MSFYKTKKMLRAIKPTYSAFTRLFKGYKSVGFKPYYLNELIAGREMLYSPKAVSFLQLGEENRDRRVGLLVFPPDWIPTAGFFALLNRAMLGIGFFDRLGFSPVIDNWNDCPYEEKDPVFGTRNVFEYYFEPLCDITLESARRSYTVIMGPSGLNMDNILYNYKGPAEEWYRPSEPYIQEMGALYRKYIRLNNHVGPQIKKDISTLLNCKKTLGIHFRGTDNKLKERGHPLALEPADYLPYIDEAMNRYGFEQIFLATDDIDALSEFRKRYNTILIYEDTYRISSGVISPAFTVDTRQLHRFRLGYEVIRDVYTLADCDGLIAGTSQVSTSARMNRSAQGTPYEYCKIIDKGLVGKDGQEAMQVYNETVKPMMK